MKTINKTDILLKALDLQLKKMLQQDLANFKATQQKTQQLNKAA
ncbi:hypothetical protein [Mucilaginibacter sp.]